MHPVHPVQVQVSQLIQYCAGGVNHIQGDLVQPTCFSAPVSRFRLTMDAVSLTAAVSTRKASESIVYLSRSSSGMLRPSRP